MDEELALWTNPILDQISQQSDHYADAALLQAMQIEIKELDKRLQQAQGRIDGAGWDKASW